MKQSKDSTKRNVRDEIEEMKNFFNVTKLNEQLEKLEKIRNSMKIAIDELFCSCDSAETVNDAEKSEDENYEASTHRWHDPFPLEKRR